MAAHLGRLVVNEDKVVDSTDTEPSCNVSGDAAGMSRTVVWEDEAELLLKLAVTVVVSHRIGTNTTQIKTIERKVSTSYG